MSEIRTAYSDFVRFRLKANNTPSHRLNQEPDGWIDDDLELDRHKKYHGIFTKFSNKLIFTAEAKDYILIAYGNGDINNNLRLIKEELKNITLQNGSSEVKWVESYNAIADFKTLKVKGNRLEINFNSNDLAELIKSHEGDEFELERKDSIDGVVLDDAPLKTIDIEGRIISAAGVSKLDLTTFKTDARGDYQRRLIPDNGYVAAGTLVVSQGASQRHSNVYLDGSFPEGNNTSASALEAMFFRDDIADLGTLVDLSFTFYFDVYLKNAISAFNEPKTVQCDLVRYKWNGTGYDIISTTNLLNEVVSVNNPVGTQKAGSYTFTGLEYNEGLMFRWELFNGDGIVELRTYEFNLNINVIETYQPSYDLKFMFTHDVYERLLYIMTGEKNRFYSKFFGRVGLTDENNAELYAQDGLDENGDNGGGLIGLISGFWLRAFDSSSEKYRSMQISLEDLISSSQAVFNIGVGIETVNFKERLRVEELKYFYREETVVKLPFQVSNEERSVDEKHFYSGTTFGYSNGGNYENEVGLDEPNTVLSHITPIRKSSLKYEKKSKIRGDDVGMELTRRLPQVSFPDEDTSQDTHNWWLDLIRKPVEDDRYRQANWDDRLTKIPTGITHPESWRGMIFTPLRMMFRHGWVLRAGLESYLYKFIRYVNGDYNSTVSMQFPNELEYSENEPEIIVNTLERSRVLPWEVKFDHPVDDDLSNLIFGKTSVLINGSYEEVPNFYFKFEWINEKGETERGYLKNLKPKGIGKFTMILANENTII